MTQSINRRTFITAAGAVLAAGRLAPPVHASARDAGAATGRRKSERLKIGLASYSLRKFPLEKAIQMARTANVRYMTFKDVHIPRTDPPEVIEANRAKIEAAGITIMGGGTITMENDPTQIRRDFEYAKHAGMPMIYASPDPAALDVIEQLVKEFDIRLCIHNHGPEDKWYPAPADAYKLIASRDARLGLCVDVGHTMRTGTDPIEAIAKYRDRVYDLHIKDLTNATDRDSQVEVGRGLLDVPRLMRTLLDIGYQGQVGLEYEIKEDDPLPGIIESIAYMRGVLEAV
ncbi:MAG TPA: sugar phosphate isomerase/epimerase [Vicinamibacterales bacterium]|nr:sugar phosphate isomerase/epimerase [Vicinamibacterales bacterium]